MNGLSGRNQWAEANKEAVTVAQCSGKTKDGKKCRAKAGASGKCAMHSGRNRAKELARKSVEARRQSAEEARTRLKAEAPRSPEELILQLAEAFAQLKNGELDEGLARALATVGNTILKGFEVSDVRKQLAEIEQLLQQRT